MESWMPRIAPFFGFASSVNVQSPVDSSLSRSRPNASPCMTLNKPVKRVCKLRANRATVSIARKMMQYFNALVGFNLSHLKKAIRVVKSVINWESSFMMCLHASTLYVDVWDSFLVGRDSR